MCDLSVKSNDKEIERDKDGEEEEEHEMRVDSLEANRSRRISFIRISRNVRKKKRKSTDAQPVTSPKRKEKHAKKQ